VFIGGLLIFGSLTPGFSHSTRAVSRLGAIGTPWGLGFTVVGLLLPGLLSVGVAYKFRRECAEERIKTRWPTALLVYGIMMSLTAIPADFNRMFASPLTWVHAFFVLVSPLILFVAIPGCVRCLRFLGVSNASSTLFAVLGYLPVLELPLYGVFTHAPGLVQRLTILTTHLAIAWLSVSLLRLRRIS